MKSNNLIPELGASDYKKSLRFYTRTLGFKIEYSRENFAYLSLQWNQIMLEQANDHWATGKLEYPFGRGMNFQIGVKEIKPIIESLKTARYQVFRKPKENWYRKGKTFIGCKEFLVKDPDGYLLRFHQKIGKKHTI